MNRMFLYLVISFVFLESVYHISSFGFSAMNPFLSIGCILIISAVETLCMSFGKKKFVNTILFWVISILNYFIFLHKSR